MVTVIKEDLRFDVPLYSLAEAALYLGVPSATFSSWAKGYGRQSPDRPPVTGVSVLSAVTTSVGSTVSFVALAEGMVLAAIRSTGVPMQRIRPALLAVQDAFGIDHALANQRLFTDGADVFYDFAEQHAGSDAARSALDLVVRRGGQGVFAEIITEHLQRIEYGADGYARLLHLPAYRRGQVVADPTRSYGQPMFVHGGAKISDVLDRFQAGDSLPVLAEDFGVPVEDLEDALRVASRRAA